MFGIIDEQVVEAFHGPKPKTGRQQFEPAMPEQRTAGEPLGRISDRDGKPIGKGRFGDTRRDIASGFVNVA